jgi:hypothetical protein
MVAQTMAILMQVTLELSGPDGPVLGQDAQADRREVDAGVKVLAAGGIDGAIAAVNAVIAEQGYELRRIRPGE